MVTWCARAAQAALFRQNSVIKAMRTKLCVHSQLIDARTALLDLPDHEADRHWLNVLYACSPAGMLTCHAHRPFAQICSAASLCLAGDTDLQVKARGCLPYSEMHRAWLAASLAWQWLPAVLIAHAALLQGNRHMCRRASGAIGSWQP